MTGPNVMANTDTYLRINELKNYLYCPRISYYALCLGIDRETGLSHMGIDAERETKTRMKRRKHALHAVVDGERLVDVALVNHELRLIGKIDEIVRIPDGLYLVDYKDTDRDYGYWQLQMCAYKICTEETFDEKVLGCYIYLISDQEYHEIKHTRHDQKKMARTVEAIGRMVNEERCPPPAKQLGKCRVCQYARFCNDVF